MRKNQMTKMLGKSCLFFKKHSATMLVIMSGVGVVLTAVESWKASAEATERVRAATVEKEAPLTRTETVIAVAPACVKPVVFGTVTLACIFGANFLNKQQQAMLSSAYALARTSFDDYKRKLKELYGEETHNKVVDALAVEKAMDTYVGNSYFGTNCDIEVEENDGSPKLFYDSYSKRYFETTIEKVLIAEYHLNRNYMLRGDAILNEFYEFLGLEKTKYGAVLGWAPLDESMQWIEFNHRKVTMDDGLICYIIEMPFEPRENYWEYELA